MGLKIGMLTSGGDCQALNAAMRGVAKTLYKQEKDVKIYGFLNGYKGLIYGKYELMKEKDFSGILTEGGTILGTSREPFKYINNVGEDGVNKVPAMIDTYKKLDLDCLVVLGGNGSHKTAGLLKSKGLNVVTLPKTIDNDIAGSDHTFGFMSAVDIATTALDQIHSTAASHSRVFIVELMGHKTGWLTLYAGIAGGADIILLPEIPYETKAIVKTIKERSKKGKKFTIIAMAEGAISEEDAKLSKKERREVYANYPSVSYKLSAELTEATGQEVSVTIPGHVQRGGSPDPFDRVLATRLGIAAAELIINKEYGYMVCEENNQISKIAIEEVAGKTRLIEIDDPMLEQAEKMGICLGR